MRVTTACARGLLSLSLKICTEGNFLFSKIKMPFYAVKRGRETGVFTNWKECEEQIKGFNGARYKKFPTEPEASEFVNAPHSPGKAPKTTDLSDSSGDAKIAKRSHSPSSEEGEKDDDIKGKKQKTGEKRGVVYTDGCCHFNGRHGACGGIGVYWGADDSKNVSEKLEGNQTNNRAEIQAAVKACKQAADMDIDVLEINTDSQFMINSMTKWIAGWKKKGWITASKEPVKNKEDFQELDEAMQKLKNVEWVHVEAHKGIEGNEAADKLAKAGAKIKK